MTQTKAQTVTKAAKVHKPYTLEPGTPEASRLAVVILEVLAGVRTPQEAAAVLGVAPPRYYQLETRALNGLVAALEPRPKGKQPSLEGRIAQLERELSAAHRETSRQQALVRAAQRSLGIKATPVTEGKPTEKDRRGRRKRRPTVRALKAARALNAHGRSAEGDLLQQASASLPSVVPAVVSHDTSGGTVPQEQGARQ